MSEGSSRFDATDRAQLAERGVSLAEAKRQLTLLERPPRYTALVRPCTVGDGILRLSAERQVELIELHAEAAAAGRFTKFVPASGAATRMFRELLYYQQGQGRGTDWGTLVAAAGEGDERAQIVARFFERLEDFAFRDELRQRVAAAGQRAGERYDVVLDALLSDHGMNYDALPKGLLAFHRYADGSRTAFEEHLVEAVQYVRDSQGLCRLHFTVSPEHLEGFRALEARVAERHGRPTAARFEIGYSVQKPSTDTLALDASASPLRDTSGRLVFRPGGHGALIENVADLGADLVYVKNIDNVQPDDLKEATLHWKPILGGLLVELERRVFDTLAAIEQNADDNAVETALGGLRELLALDERGAALEARLRRPLRVVGVVPNTGEPGGGPFWVADGDGRVRTQVVETAQVDPEDAGQQKFLAGSTHFSPVDLVLGLRDEQGNSYDLHGFIDHDAVIITRKSARGVDFKVLERPGLWNGAMAGWNTVLVEVPLATFTPVKSVLDLLRPEHQSGQ